jgi:hypothetical protein
VPKKNLQLFLIDQKFKFLALTTFDVVPKVVRTDFGTRSKVLIMVSLTFKTFDLVPKLVLTTFNLLPRFLALD